MAGRADIKAGSAFVELYTKNSKFHRGLADAQRQLKAFAGDVQALGQTLATASLAMLAPVALSVNTFADFEQALAGVRASANPTNRELERLRESALKLSEELKADPTEILSAFGELLKAGMSVEQVLGGAGKAAVGFARVGELDMAQAATVMADAVTVFGESADKTINTLSAAADGSSISIDQVAQSFSMASAVAGMASQSLDDLATSIAILGNNGLKGSDGGTSLKTMLLSLMAPSDTAAAVIERVGLNVRDATGKMLPMRGIIEQLQQAFGKLAPTARDAALKDLFGTDGLRAGMILLKGGTAGWDAMRQSMDGALSVSEKYEQLTSTINGALQEMWAAVKRLGIALGESLQGQLAAATKWISGTVAVATEWIKANKDLVVGIIQAAAAVGAFGAGLMGLGLAASATAATLAGLAALASPLGLLVAAVVGLGAGAMVLAEVTKATADLKHEMSALRAEGDKQRATDQQMFARLEELAGKQKRSADEIKEAIKIVDELNTRYAMLGVTVNALTGEINMASYAQAALNEGQREQAMAQVNAEVEEARQNVAKAQRAFDDFQGSASQIFQALWNSRGSGKTGAEELLQELTNAERALAEKKKRQDDLANNKAGSSTGGKPGEKSPEDAKREDQIIEDGTAAREKAQDAQKEWDKIEEQLARKRRSRHENEIHDIKEAANERRKLLDVLIAGAKAEGKSTADLEAQRGRIDAEEAQDVDAANKRHNDAEAKKEREKQERIDDARHSIQDEIANLEIDLNPNTSKLEKELQKLAIQMEAELRDALENSVDPEMIRRKFELQRQLLQQQESTNSQRDPFVTFNAEALQAGGRASSMASSMERTAKAAEVVTKKLDLALIALREAGGLA